MQSLWKKTFALPRRFNKVELTNFSFKWVQSIRLFLIAGLSVLLFLIFYVLAKLSIVYFIFWAVFFMILSEVMLSCAAGRQRLERKMRRDLQEYDPTFYWRTAIRLYDLSFPFYLMCLVIFYLPGMQNDVACTLQLLSCTAAAGDPQTLDRQQCLAQRSTCVDSNIRDIIPTTRNRWTLFVVSMWAPLLVVVFEFFANRMVIKFSHISYQFIMWISYWFATFLGEVLAGYPIFP